MHITRPYLSVAIASLACAFAILAGCRFDPAGVANNNNDAAPVPDGNVNTPDAPEGIPDAEIVDIPCESWVAYHSHFDPCAIPAPSTEIVLSNGIYELNTDNGVLQKQGEDPIPYSGGVVPGSSPQAWVMSVESLQINSAATLRAVGSRPLIVASWTNIGVDGTIDVSSNVNGTGAGANPAACGTSTGGPGLPDPDGGGGGGGGGFNSAGGTGATGRFGDPTKGGLGGAGGAPSGAPTNVRGGCAGGNGGDGNVAATAGAGSAGGGAVQLTALASITVTGKVHAGGAGGQGATGGRSGGGGGGSGGLIGLESPSVTTDVSAIFAANGGGGGGGSDAGAAQAGDDAKLASQVAPGGAGQGKGGDGGDGGFLDSFVGEDGIFDDRGGGGGGGGVGFIIIKSLPSQNLNGTYSPAKLVL